jgi:hypothetical protein
MHFMRKKPLSPVDHLDDGVLRSIILVSSTSGYFGGTGVSAYIASKHGVTGILRGSQKAAKKYGVSVRAVAPFFTPTRITSSFAGEWKNAGLDANTPEMVGKVIAQCALEEGKSGSCLMVSLSGVFFCILAFSHELQLTGGYDRLRGSFSGNWSSRERRSWQSGLDKMLLILWIRLFSLSQI